MEKKIFSKSKDLNSISWTFSVFNFISMIFTDITPSIEVVEHCTAFLCNIGEWNYLSDLNNTADGFIEVSMDS